MNKYKVLKYFTHVWDEFFTGKQFFFYQKLPQKVNKNKLFKSFVCVCVRERERLTRLYLLLKEAEACKFDLGKEIK